MNNIIEKEKIENLIYENRGKQVMLDSDLARLYECVNGTKTINQAVSRHLDRFPNDFYFQLTSEEYKNLKSQVGTANINKMSRTLPYAFTEQGVAMLASILRTKVAAEVSVNIMRAFVLMKKYISDNLLEQRYINNQVFKNTEDIKLLQESFNKLSEKRKNTDIFFNGQIYDAYSKIQNIFKTAKKELIIIDAYADNVVLDIIKRLDIKVTIITKPNNLLTKQDIEKYNKQYNNLKVIYDNTYHDRYFIIDDKEIYHCGTSINRIGYKTFSITLMNDEDSYIKIIDNVNKIINNKTKIIL